MGDKKTLTRMDIAAALHREVGLNKKDSSEVLQLFIEEVIQALDTDEILKVPSFGRFSVLHKGSRVGRNPKTGVEVSIEPRRVVTFKPSQLLKSRVAQSKL